MRKLIILSAAALLAASTLPGMAQSRDDRREWRQQERIWNGVARGELTQREIYNLERQQRRVDRAQHRAERDGYVTRREARRIERMQDRASRNIWRKQHNDRGYW
jgi:hypothetical protein